MLASSSSLNPPVTIISLYVGACKYNLSYKNCAKSDLFSDSEIKFDQFLCKGTYRPSTSLLIGLAALQRLVLVDALIDISLYLSNTMSIVFNLEHILSTVLTLCQPDHHK